MSIQLHHLYTEKLHSDYLRIQLNSYIFGNEYAASVCSPGMCTLLAETIPDNSFLLLYGIRMTPDGVDIFFEILQIIALASLIWAAIQEAMASCTRVVQN